MDGMIPEMRMESVCTRNGTWEPDPGQLNCTPRRTTTYTVDESPHPPDVVHYIVAGGIASIVILFLIIVIVTAVGLMIRLKTMSFNIRKLK